MVKILTDRRPYLTLFADKLRSRAWARARAPALAFPALYWWSEHADEIPFDELPRSFALKANHGSGFNLLVADKGSVSRNALVSLGRQWLRSDFTRVGREWAYRNVRRTIYAEELLPGSDAAPPLDYKLFLFGGRLRVIQVDEGRGARHTQSLYDEHWTFFEGTVAATQGRPRPPPASLATMVEAAEALSAGVDFVRVDFYDVDGRALFGELTNYPNKGISRFQPPALDMLLGEYLCLDDYSKSGPAVDYAARIDENMRIPPAKRP
ncbi:MAG TPA: ATP-grasp fold amidoligase family protein [Casimicrobiaceae bacterium]